MKGMKILVTGAAGFIGYHLCKRLTERGDHVLGLDNINGYYDVSLKYGRLAELGIRKDGIRPGAVVESVSDSKFGFVQIDCTDKQGMGELFAAENFDAVCHLAAQAGVRYSIENPEVYISSNLVGFFNILETCRQHGVDILSYASSSSVYGSNKEQPFSTEQNVDHPISLYAATKKSNELMAHTYSHLFGLRTTGLRFFTVYGPWGRPDMALFKFTKAISEGAPIEVNNFGNMKRDFTYIDDIIEGVVRVIDNPPEPEAALAPYKVYNIGRGAPVGLMEFIEEIEKQLGKKAEKIMKPLPAGDVPETFADVSALARDHGYSPSVDIRDGIKQFTDWYKEYYGI